jgi:hypothetical protein
MLTLLPMTLGSPQVERKNAVRALVPAPKRGELPLPAAAASPSPSAPSDGISSDGTRSDGPAASRFDLAAGLASFPEWSELPWPKGANPAPPQQHPLAVLDFKVRPGTMCVFVSVWVCERGGVIVCAFGSSSMQILLPSLTPSHSFPSPSLPPSPPMHPNPGW